MFKRIPDKRLQNVSGAGKPTCSCWCQCEMVCACEFGETNDADNYLVQAPQISATVETGNSPAMFKKERGPK